MKKIISKPRFRTIAQNIALLIGSLLICFFFIEIGYRVLDPFPYFSSDEVNLTQHGNLSQFDEILGWKGVPDGEAEFVTLNNRVWLAHNKDGFRDIEHTDSSNKRPAIVFLGDSFTWGYEVEFDEMFTNLLREKLPGYEIFNLAHRGYGTDQAFLTFTQWHDNRDLNLVILMVSENDVEENNASIIYEKPKPQYKIIDNELVLTSVPIPKTEDWIHSQPEEKVPNSWKASFENFLFRSHFLHDVDFRVDLYLSSVNSKQVQQKSKKRDFNLTFQILAGLKKDVEASGAKLIIFFIPSKREIEQLDNLPPYQIEFSDMCQKLGIEYYDLASDFKTTWPRTYYRYGTHWNSRGHQVAAEAIYRELELQVNP